MNIELIKSEFEKLSLIISSWRDGEDVSAIERDIALDKLKTIYDTLRFDTPARQTEANGPGAALPSPAAETAAATEGDTAEEDAGGKIDEAAPQDDVEVEFIFAEDEEEAAEEPVPAEPDATEDSDGMTTQTAVETTEAAATPTETETHATAPAAETAAHEATATAPAEEAAAYETTAHETEEAPATETAAHEAAATPAVGAQIPAERPAEQSQAIPEERPAQRRDEEPSPERKPEGRPDNESAQPARRPMSSLFGADEIHSRPRTKHHRMMSIYNDAQPRPEKVVDISKIFDMEMDEPIFGRDAVNSARPAVTPRAEQRTAPSAEPAPSPSPADTAGGRRPDGEPQNTTLGDTIGARTQTLADTLGKPAALAEEITHTRIGSLRQAIGINDKFLMIRDLFDGDGEAYDEAIRTLDGFDTLDDCMIHIVENYAWNPDSEGAKFIMQLLERKLS